MKSKLRDFKSGETAIIRGWGGAREVRVVAHDDCNLTTLQNLRTGSQWTVSSFYGATEPALEIERRKALKREGCRFYHGPKLGAEEWVGWNEYEWTYSAASPKTKSPGRSRG